MAETLSDSWQDTQRTLLEGENEQKAVLRTQLRDPVIREEERICYIQRENSRYRWDTDTLRNEVLRKQLEHLRAAVVLRLARMIHREICLATPVEQRQQALRRYCQNHRRAMEQLAMQLLRDYETDKDYWIQRSPGIDAIVRDTMLLLREAL